MNNQIEKIEKFFSKDFILKYKNLMIFQNENGSYDLFDRYTVSSKHNAGYKLVSKYNSTQKTFFSLKNAVSWCIFDYRNKFAERNRIEYLDAAIVSIESEIQVHKSLVNKKTINYEDKLVYYSKLSEELIKKKQFQEEMNSFVIQSKMWQVEKFAAK